MNKEQFVREKLSNTTGTEVERLVDRLLNEQMKTPYDTRSFDVNAFMVNWRPIRDEFRKRGFNVEIVWDSEGDFVEGLKVSY
jgi:hypothetical protein